MKYQRSTTEILLDVLKAVDMDYGAPTRIMYAANLSWAPARKYLKMLEDKKLIMFVNNPQNDKRTPKIYRITEEGKLLLRDAKRVFNLMGVSFREGR